MKTKAKRQRTNRQITKKKKKRDKNTKRKNTQRPKDVLICKLTRVTGGATYIATLPKIALSASANVVYFVSYL